MTIRNVSLYRCAVQPKLVSKITLRIMCDECSRGNAGPHDCRLRESEDGTRNFGLAVKNYEDAVRVLRKRMTIIEGTDFSGLETVFDARVPLAVQQVLKEPL